MTTSLRLAAVAIATGLLTTSAFAATPQPFTGVVLVAPAGSTTAPTLVQQLQAELAYQLAEAAEYNTPTYHTFRAQRIAKQLQVALAAAAAGTPLPPQTKENGEIMEIRGTVCGAPCQVTGGVVAPGPIASAPPAPPSENALARAVNALVAALGGDGGTPSSNPDTGTTSANPGTSIASASPETGIASSNPDTGIPSANPDTGTATKGGG